MDRDRIGRIQVFKVVPGISHVRVRTVGVYSFTLLFFVFIHIPIIQPECAVRFLFIRIKEFDFQKFLLCIYRYDIPDIAIKHTFLIVVLRLHDTVSLPV